MNTTKTNLAPIALFVYNRPWHTVQTLNALMKNDLALESMLYIYSDGPKENASEESLNKIAAVRKVVRNIKWCKEVNIIESPKNKGLATSIKTGVSEIIKKHGQVIVLEDDLVTSPSFLNYMNNALSYYKDRQTVFSISAHCLPPTLLKIPDDYEYDVFVSLRNSSWGWATWRNRWEQIDWKVSHYEILSNNEYMKEAFNRGGDDVFELLKLQKSRKLDIWAIQFTFAHFVNHAVSIVPTISYVDNIGLDGSGENCNICVSQRNKLLCDNKNIHFIDILYEDKRIINAFYNVYCRKKRPLWQKIINRLSRIMGGKSPFIIKKKIYR